MLNDQTHSDNLQFADETDNIAKTGTTPWNIMIVDDEREIHRITEMVLGGIIFRERGINFIHASSGEEAIIKLQQHKDVAVLLLDVVMETENAGLVVVNRLRNELKNTETRIILRTGHPGYAPESKIIIDYDINDYKEKTEITSQRLVTSVISALRSYSDIVKIRELNQTLEQQVIERTMQLEETNKVLNRSFKKIREDLQAGRKIQFRLLPERDKFFGEYFFSRYLIPSMYLSGDFVDYFRIDEERLGFYFADVCGHGTPSAFVTILLKFLIDAYIKELSPQSIEYLTNPAKFLKLINEQLLKENTDKHITLFYGVINTKNNEMTFSHGGQFPHPIMLDNGKPYFIDHSGGMPLGLYDMAEYEEHTIKLAASFLLIMFSDGILEIIPRESMEEKQQYFLSKITNKNLSYDDIMKLYDITDNLELQDDITYLIIRK